MDHLVSRSIKRQGSVVGRISAPRKPTTNVSGIVGQRRVPDHWCLNNYHCRGGLAWFAGLAPYRPLAKEVLHRAALLDPPFNVPQQCFSNNVTYLQSADDCIPFSRVNQEESPTANLKQSSM